MDAFGCWCLVCQEVAASIGRITFSPRRTGKIREFWDQKTLRLTTFDGLVVRGRLIWVIVVIVTIICYVGMSISDNGQVEYLHILHHLAEFSERGVYSA